RADDADADLDPLVDRVARLGERLRDRERRRVVRGSRHPLRARTSSVSFGRIWWTSPTTPRSQNSKIGAFGSLLIATIVPEPCMPAWVANSWPSALPSAPCAPPPVSAASKEPERKSASRGSDVQPTST